MPERRICIVTGTRAEYGLLFWLMKQIEADAALKLQLIVTGAHLEERFGSTVDVIVKDGFRVDARVPLYLEDDRPVTVARASGNAVSGLAAAFERLSPEIVVLLGDRYEMIAAAQAAMLLQVPIAHIHGGEATEGLIDEAIRHAVTKMAHLHFASAEPYRHRIIQMGEDPARVFTVGAPGLDNIAQLDLPGRTALGTCIGLDLEDGYFLVTYHPVTLSDQNPAKPVHALLAALDRMPKHKIIITGVNADPGGTAVDQAFCDYAADHPNRVRHVASLGQARYLGAVKHADAVVGNSSSGLIEVPALATPTVNIGPRQRGRLRAASVIDCGESESEISDALAMALSDTHRAIAANAETPYGKPGVSRRIKDVLASAPLDNILMKRFFDIPIPA